MVEVFKTNVRETSQAEMLLEQIHMVHKGYKANFDLEDCDKILRVKCVNCEIQSASLISLLNHFGFHAEILKDEVNTTARYADHFVATHISRYSFQFLTNKDNDDD